MPWVTRLEQEVDFKLFKNNTSSYNKINMSSLLRGDQKSRQEFYKTMLDRGVYSINTVLDYEDMNPIDGELGDLRIVQANMVNIKDVASGKHNPARGQQQNKDSKND
jgi:phage portal protein BeeE